MVIVRMMEGVRDLHDSNGIVVKDSGYVFRREFVGRVADQKTGLSYSTVAHYDTPDECLVSPETPHTCCGRWLKSC